MHDSGTRAECARRGSKISELRVVARAWHGPHVNEPGHRVGLQQSNELGEGQYRMARGQNDRLGVLLRRYSRQL